MITQLLLLYTAHKKEIDDMALTKERFLAIVDNARRREIIDVKEEYRRSLVETEEHFRNLRNDAEAYCLSICPKCGAKMEITEGYTYLHMLCEAHITHSESVELDG